MGLTFSICTQFIKFLKSWRMDCIRDSSEKPTVRYERGLATFRRRSR